MTKVSRAVEINAAKVYEALPTGKWVSVASLKRAAGIRTRWSMLDALH